MDLHCGSQRLGWCQPSQEAGGDTMPDQRAHWQGRAEAKAARRGASKAVVLLERGRHPGE